MYIYHLYLHYHYPDINLSHDTAMNVLLYILRYGNILSQYG